MVDQVVGGVIVSPDGLLFIQQRSQNRPLFPGQWDIVGGHVDPGETQLQAFKREIKEETGWTLDTQITPVFATEWQTNGQQKFEVDYLITVQGDLNNPKLEETKVDAYSWLHPDELDLVIDPEDSSQSFIRTVLERSFAWLETWQPVADKWRNKNVVGTVVAGQKLARSIGYPTANLKLTKPITLPPGVYSVTTTFQGQQLGGMAYYGPKTILDETFNSFEVHWFDTHQEMYDQTLSISITDFVRPPRKLNSVDKILEQLTSDDLICRQQLAFHAQHQT